MKSLSSKWQHTAVQVACVLFLACTAAEARETGIGTPGRGFVQKLAAGNALLHNQKSLADGLHLDGAFDATVSHGLALASVGGIDDDAAAGASGALRLELLATSAKPERGAIPSDPFQLAVGPQYDGLSAGSSLSDLSFGSVIATPADGTYWLVLVLSQYDPVNCTEDDQWCVEDTMVSSAPIVFKTIVMPTVGAATLENPAPQSFQSGIGLLSGWSCDGPVSVMVDGIEIKAAYGSPRADAADACGNANSGFGVLVNYNNFGPGAHVAQLVVNGVAKGDPSQFTVTVPIGEFMRGLARDVTVPDFPSPGQTTTLTWQEAQQNFAIKSVGP